MTVASDSEPRELPLSLLRSEELLISNAAITLSRADLREDRMRSEEASCEDTVYDSTGDGCGTGGYGNGWCGGEQSPKLLEELNDGATVDRDGRTLVERLDRDPSASVALRTEGVRNFSADPSV